MREACAAMRKGYDSAALDIAALDARARRLEETAAALVRQYREENIAGRAAPAPAYFSNPPELADGLDDALAECGRHMSAAQAALDAAQTAAARAFGDLGAELDAVSKRLDGRAQE
jgi:hypothetical protein